MTTGTSDARSILEERAKRLAIPILDTSDVPLVELLHFVLADNRYAIETRFVVRVTQLGEVGNLPTLPAYFTGVANFGGEVIPLVDLPRLLGLPDDVRARGSQLLVLGRGRAEFGVVVDAADQIGLESTAGASAQARIDRKFVRAALADQRLLLDGTMLLDDPRLTVNSESIASETQEEHS